MEFKTIVLGNRNPRFILPGAYRFDNVFGHANSDDKKIKIEEDDTDYRDVIADDLSGLVKYLKKHSSRVVKGSGTDDQGDYDYVDYKIPKDASFNIEDFVSDNGGTDSFKDYDFFDYDDSYTSPEEPKNYKSPQKHVSKELKETKPPVKLSTEPLKSLVSDIVPVHLNDKEFAHIQGSEVAKSLISNLIDAKAKEKINAIFTDKKHLGSLGLLSRPIYDGSQEVKSKFVFPTSHEHILYRSPDRIASKEVINVNNEQNTMTGIIEEAAAISPRVDNAVTSDVTHIIPVHKETRLVEMQDEMTAMGMQDNMAMGEAGITEEDLENLQDLIGDIEKFKTRLGTNDRSNEVLQTGARTDIKRPLVLQYIYYPASAIGLHLNPGNKGSDIENHDLNIKQFVRPVLNTNTQQQQPTGEHIIPDEGIDIGFDKDIRVPATHGFDHFKVLGKFGVPGVKDKRYVEKGSSGEHGSYKLPHLVKANSGELARLPYVLQGGSGEHNRVPYVVKVDSREYGDDFRIPGVEFNSGEEFKKLRDDHVDHELVNNENGEIKRSIGKRNKISLCCLNKHDVPRYLHGRREATRMY